MEEDGCTADELEEAMKMVDQIEGDLNTKCLNIASWVRNLEAEAKAIKEAQDAMDKRRKGYATGKAERLRNYLFHGMKLAGVTKMQFRTSSSASTMPGVGADCPGTPIPEQYPATRSLSRTKGCAEGCAEARRGHSRLQPGTQREAGNQVMRQFVLARNRSVAPCTPTCATTGQPWPHRNNRWPSRWPSTRTSAAHQNRL